MAKTKGYSATAKSLHWLIVVLLAAQFTVAWLMPHIGRNTPVTTLISLHFFIRGHNSFDRNHSAGLACNPC